MRDAGGPDTEGGAMRNRPLPQRCVRPVVAFDSSNQTSNSLWNSIRSQKGRLPHAKNPHRAGPIGPGPQRGVYPAWGIIGT
jgi:hypothetical protein